ncbi:MAG: EAL domain-containing protein [Betaproteobacteria bacterium]|nr:EAL domain-containing protein [Betaproteobacteria bacterium]
MQGEQDQVSATNVDAYGDQARALLDALAAQLGGLAQVLARHWLDGMAGAGGEPGPTSGWPQDDLDVLRLRQEEHARHLLRASATRPELAAAGRLIGAADALRGLDGAQLSAACSAAAGSFATQAAAALGASAGGQRLALIMMQRLFDDLHARIAGLTGVVRAYQQEAVAPLPVRATPWAQFVDGQLQRIAQLPGIVACAMLRPDAQGVFRVEALAGHPAMRAFLGRDGPDELPRLDARSRHGQGLVAPAWRSGAIVYAGRYASDPRTTAWRGSWEALRAQVQVCSTVAIPVLDRAGHAVHVLLLYGSTPNQFGSAAMRVFVEGLQRRFGVVWEQAHYLRPMQPVPEAQARAWRERLFAGGLEMFVQPIVDLRDGTVGKVEALARLRGEDGGVVSPGLFLPLLGEAELHWLFREGLEQALAWLARWEAAGLRLEVSLNLPPSTLVDARCADWIHDALRRHGLPAQRLSLELLETQQIEAGLQHQAIDSLSRLGVRLAMDDLGAGYSSLKRLASSRFDLIKIDQDLFRQLHVAPLNTLNLVGSLIRLGDDYDCEIVVEGLEDAGMIEVAALLGADLGQGWGLGRPMEPERLPDWLAQRGPLPAGGRIATPMGALACAWDHARHGATQGSEGLRACPLSAYLARQGGDARRVTHLHARQHLSVLSRQERGEMLDWFVGRLCAPTAG